MTPEDFLRSITPNAIQPEYYGLDKFMNITLEASMCVVGIVLNQQDSVIGQSALLQVGVV